MKGVMNWWMTVARRSVLEIFDTKTTPFDVILPENPQYYCFSIPFLRKSAHYLVVNACCDIGHFCCGMDLIWTTTKQWQFSISDRSDIGQLSGAVDRPLGWYFPELLKIGAQPTKLLKPKYKFCQLMTDSNRSFSFKGFWTKATNDKLKKQIQE